MATAPNAVATPAQAAPGPTTDVVVDPFTTPAAFGKMTLGSFPMPGIITEIDGCDREYEWQEQKAVGQGGATTVFRGEKIAGSIKVKCLLVTVQHFLDLATLRTGVMPPRGKKPAALDVDNEHFLANHIRSVALKKFPQVKWEGNGTWSVTFEFTEHYPPRPAAVGANDGSKAKWMLKEGGAPSEVDRQVNELLDKAKKA